MPRGYMGKILRVDLTAGKWKEESVPEDWMRKYLGGAGFAARILYDELPLGIDALSPENELIFMTGPLTGTFFPNSGRWTAFAKSPVTTAIWGEAIAVVYGVRS